MNTGEKIKNFQAEMTGKTDFKLSPTIKVIILLFIFTPEITHLDVRLKGKILETISKKFKNKKTKIFGVSKDSLKSHESFKEKFNFPLICDF